MTETDSPLKALVQAYIQDIAAWLLCEEVRCALPLPTELPADALFADTLFEITLAGERSGLLHLEFQGRSSHPGMPLRQLSYLSRIVGEHPSPDFLESFVLYVEKNAGTKDEGAYSVLRMDGQPALAWRYTPLRLWQQPAEDILALGRPGIVPLVALMNLGDCQRTAQAIVKIVQSVDDGEQRQFLASSVLALMSGEECLNMLKNYFDSDGLLMDTPFLREIRRKAFSEGIEQGVHQGMEKGLEQGLEQGMQKGMVEGLLEAIELGIELKFGNAGLRLMPQIRKIKDPDILRTISEGIRSSSSLGELRTLFEE